MKSKLLTLLTLIVVAGCSSSATEKQIQHYVLPKVESALAVKQLSPVEIQLADHLTQAGIVYQQSATEVTQARYHQWAGDLAEQITQQLQRQSYRKPEELMIYFEQFNGSYTGKAQLAGFYVWQDNPEQRIPFAVEVPLVTEGYPALVAALAQGLTKLSEQINLAIN